MKVIEMLQPSKAAICQAFIELMDEKPYDKISVISICKKSLLGRATFYLHFRNKKEVLTLIEDLLVEGFMELVLKVRTTGVDVFYQYMLDGGHPVYLNYFTFMRENKKPFTALYRPQDSVTLAQKMRDAFLDVDAALFRNYVQVSEQAILRYWNLFATGFFNIIEDWIRHGMDLSNETMSELLAVYWLGFVFQNISLLKKVYQEIEIMEGHENTGEDIFLFKID